MEILLLRHGKTSGNYEHRYVGRTDEPLCPEGIENLKALFAQNITHPNEPVGCFFKTVYRKPKLPCFVSPMLRCRQSLDLILQNIYKYYYII